MSAFRLPDDEDRRVELTNLQQTLASSRELVARSRKLIRGLDNVRKRSRELIAASHILLDKAQRLTKPDPSKPGLKLQSAAQAGPLTVELDDIHTPALSFSVTIQSEHLPKNLREFQADTFGHHS